MDATEVVTTPVAGPALTRSRLVSAHRVARAVHYLIALLAVTAAVVGAIVFDTDGSIFMGWQGPWLVRELVPGTVAFALTGAVVLRHPPAAAVGWSMLAVGLLWGGSVLSAGLFYLSIGIGWTVSTQFFVASHFLREVGWFSAAIVLPQVFPNGWLRGWVWRILLVAAAASCLVGNYLRAVLSWEDSVQGDFAPVTLETLHRLDLLSWYASIALVLATLIERVRRGPQLVRQQVAPMAVVWLATMAGLEIRARQYADSDSSWSYAAAWLWPVVAAVTIGVTAMQVGLWDSRLVIRRFVVYAAGVVVLTLVFAGVYFAMLLALSSQAVDDHYRWLALLAAAVAVIAADPVRRRLRTTLERRLLGERSEPLRPLGRLDALSSLADAEDEHVYQTITKTVADAVLAPGVTLAVHQPAGIEVLATTGTTPVDPLIIPLLHRGERLGEIRIAARTPGEPYGRHDRAFLDRMAHQAAALVYGLRRDTDIAALRSEAIEALVEQRVALGRDLHDGLAPLLAGAGLTAEALRRGMPADSPDAEQAARLSTRLRNAASEVRRLSHDLQPHPDGPHLTAVIADYVASVSGPQVPAFTVTLDERAAAGLSATAELALSRVALEAITNVVRHSHAARAEVSLQREGPDLVLRVSDDGVGIARPYVSGLGITSMRSRVQALGGTFDLEPGRDRGTVIMVRVPVPR